MVLLLAAWLLGIQGGTGQNVTVLPPPGVVLEVTMPSGSVNRLTIPSGKHGSIGSVLGPTLDLSPTVKEDGSLEITVTPVGWDPATSSVVSGTPERQVVQPGETTSFVMAPFPIVVKWLGTVASAAPSGSSIGDDRSRTVLRDLRLGRLLRLRRGDPLRRLRRRWVQRSERQHQACGMTTADVRLTSCPGADRSPSNGERERLPELDGHVRVEQEHQRLRVTTPVFHWLPVGPRDLQHQAGRHDARAQDQRRKVGCRADLRGPPVRYAQCRLPSIWP